VIPVKIRLGETGNRFCLGCFTKLLINDDGNIVKAEQTTPLVSSKTFSDDGKVLLTCPNCNVQAPPVHISNDKAFAVCPLCKELVVHNIIRKGEESPDEK
jgi:NAD-dependent SIR2 family protein deacetylase